MIQTMRSWSTLMPGEHFTCIGCHDSTSTYVTSTAGEPKTLQPFFDIKDDYLYFPKHVQPILDRNCVKSGCHDSENDTLDLTGEKLWTRDLTDTDNKNAYRFWLRSYLNLSNKKYCSYNAIFDIAEGIKPKSLGSSKSKVVTQLLAGHNDVALTEEEMGKLCAWIDLAVPHSGKFTDDMKPEDSARYEARLDRRREHEQLEAQNIAQFVAAGGYGTPEYQQTGIA
jgi:hypothetical protein